MGNIAPHINNEVRLILGGNKPLATIEKRKDPLQYSLAIALSNTGSIVVDCSPTVDSKEGECILTLPKNKDLIINYKWLLKNGVDQLGIKQYHRSMGALFGYSLEDINEFIDNNINCDCHKCKGA